MMSKREFKIRNSKPWYAITHICVPTVFLMVTQAIYNVIDKYLAIALSSSDIASSSNYNQAIFEYMNTNNLPSLNSAAAQMINLATQFSGNIFSLIIAVGIMFAGGTGILFSISFGAKNKLEMKKTLNSGFLLSIIGSLVLTLLIFLLILPSFNYPIFELQSNISDRSLNITTALNSLSFDYSVLMCAFIPIFFLNYFFIFALRTEGRMFFVSIITVVSILLNILLAYIFMGVMHLKLIGAMLATVCAITFSLISCIILCVLSPTSNVKIHLKKYLFDKRITKNIFLAGLTPLITNLSAVFISLLCTNLSGNLPVNNPVFDNTNGKLQTLYSAISPWLFLSLAPAFGLFQGGIIIMGYAYGAKRYHRFKEIIQKIMILEIIWFSFCFLMFCFFGQYMLALFNDKFPNHKTLLIINFATFPLAFITYTSVAYLQAAKMGKISTISSSLRSVLVAAPLILIGFAISQSTGNPLWMFLFYGFNDLISSIIIVFIMIKVTKNYRGYYLDYQLNQCISDFKTFDELNLEAKIKNIEAKIPSVRKKSKLNNLGNKLIVFQQRLSEEHDEKGRFELRLKNNLEEKEILKNGYIDNCVHKK